MQRETRSLERILITRIERYITLEPARFRPDGPHNRDKLWTAMLEVECGRSSPFWQPAIGGGYLNVAAVAADPGDFADRVRRFLTRFQLTVRQIDDLTQRDVMRDLALDRNADAAGEIDALLSELVRSPDAEVILGRLFTYPADDA